MFAAATGAGRADAQIVYGQKSSVMQSLTYLSWRISGDTSLTLSQWYVPVYVRGAISSGWDLSIYSAVSGTSTKPTTAQGEITGVNDSRIQLSHAMADDRILLSAGVSLPTGQTKLTPLRRALLPWLSADFFNFPLKTPGEGLNLFGELGVAAPLSGWTMGMAGAVYYSGKYEPYDDRREYQPGLRVVGTVGLHRDWPHRGHLGADLITVYSADDKVDGLAVFGDGIQFDIRAAGSRMSTRGRIEAALRFIARGKNRRFDAGNADLVRERNNTNGNDLRANLALHHVLAGRLQGWVTIDAKILAANEYGLGSPLYEGASRIYGFGGGIDLGFGSGVIMGLGGRYWTGSSDGSGAFKSLDLSGFEIIQRLTLTL